MPGFILKALLLTTCMRFREIEKGGSYFLDAFNSLPDLSRGTLGPSSKQWRC